MAVIISGLLLILGASLVESRALWSSKPASQYNIIKEAYVVGNGRLGGTCNRARPKYTHQTDLRTAMPFGEAGSEQLSLNVDSLWSGGPFENAVRTLLGLPVSGGLPSK